MTFEAFGANEHAPDQRHLSTGTRLVVPFMHEGSARDAVLALKRGRDRRAVRSLADAIADLVAPMVSTEVTITWAPTTAMRRRRRGYDQAEILARAVAARLGRGCRPTLQRLSGASQAGRGRADRLVAPDFVPLWVPSRVVIIDDVVTTGATLTAAAGALIEGGAEVLCAAAATSSDGAVDHRSDHRSGLRSDGQSDRRSQVN